MNDPTPAQLATLSPRMAEIAAEIINACRDVGIPLIIVAKGARRSPEEQSKLLRAGLSATRNSAHLTGDAVDFDIYGLARGDIPQVFWDAFGPFVESFGLTWGGRWRHPYDPGHVELPKSQRSA